MSEKRPPKRPVKKGSQGNDAETEHPAASDAYLQSLIEDSFAFEEHAKNNLKRANTLIERFFSPTLIGAENLPEQPVLIVANHAFMAIDAPLIQCTLLDHCDRLARGMADTALFSNERARNFLVRQGAIVGHPRVCSAMMKAGQDLLVFPGGAYEVNKPVSARYTLIWRERLGFARMAAEHGYTILPVATVGPDEFYGRYMESEEWLHSRFGKLLIKYGLLDPDIRPDLLPPIPSGLFGGILPKPQRFMMSIGQPIDLSAYKDQPSTDEHLKAIRDQVEISIKQQIQDLLLLRAQTKESEGWLRRLLTR